MIYDDYVLFKKSIVLQTPTLKVGYVFVILLPRNHFDIDSSSTKAAVRIPSLPFVDRSAAHCEYLMWS